ncbi:hypothetical protein CFOL_v3_05663, partial [Cephalotus follicularis]
NNDFDPFMVALDNVKQEENRGRTQADNNNRRARSMSPIRINHDSVAFKIHNNPPVRFFTVVNQSPRMDAVSPAYSIWVPNQNRQICQQNLVKQGQKSPIKLAEPKGELFARRARLVKMAQEKPSKTSETTLLEPRVGVGENGKESGGSCTKVSKRQKIKNFLLMSASLKKTIEDKQTDQNEVPSNMS